MTLHVSLPDTGGTSEGSKTTHTHAHQYKPMAHSSSSSLPPFVQSSSTPDDHLNVIFNSILKAKRITVVCGAGISVEAGLPDFRSPDGLFQSLKRDNPKESLTSGKDLFDASVFRSPEKIALFCRMIASMASLSSQSEPTAFHTLLRTLDDRGQLLRVYTQNIDALEMKAGLSFGVPEFEERFLRAARRVGKAKAKAKATRARVTAKDNNNDNKIEDGSAEIAPTTEDASAGKKKAKTKTKTKGRKSAESGLYSYTPKKSKRKALLADRSDNTAEFASAAWPTHSADVAQVAVAEEPLFTDPTQNNHAPRLPLNTIPRCIPLHGTLLSLHCQHCTQTFPLRPPPLPSQSQVQSQSHTPPRSRSCSSSPDPSLAREQDYDREDSTQDQASSSSKYTFHTLLSQGTPPACPSCTSLEQTRALVRKRLRGVGKLMPSVVLYGEEHREGESVGEAVRRDLCGIEVEVETERESSATALPLIENSGLQLVTAPISHPLPLSPSPTPTVTTATATALPPPPPKKKTYSRTVTGKGPDLLLVVGTSLRVPGTKRIVREFSKAVKSLHSSTAATTGSRRSGSTTVSTATSSTTTSPTVTPRIGTAHLPMPTPPPFSFEREGDNNEFETCQWSLDNANTMLAPPKQPITPARTPKPSSKSKSKSKSTSTSKSHAENKIRTIYLNKEFPSTPREWEDVFDVWVQGDAQVFARALAAKLISEKRVDMHADVDVDVDVEGVEIEVGKDSMVVDHVQGYSGGNGAKKRKRGDEVLMPKKKKKRSKDTVEVEIQAEAGLAPGRQDADRKNFPLTPPATVHRPMKLESQFIEVERYALGSGVGVGVGAGYAAGGNTRLNTVVALGPGPAPWRFAQEGRQGERWHEMKIDAGWEHSIFG